MIIWSYPVHQNVIYMFIHVIHVAACGPAGESSVLLGLKARPHIFRYIPSYPLTIMPSWKHFSAGTS